MKWDVMRGDGTEIGHGIFVDSLRVDGSHLNKGAFLEDIDVLYTEKKNLADETNVLRFLLQNLSKPPALRNQPFGETDEKLDQ